MYYRSFSAWDIFIFILVFCTGLALFWFLLPVFLFFIVALFLIGVCRSVYIWFINRKNLGPQDHFDEQGNRITNIEVIDIKENKEKRDEK